jgi:release factor glutamine methyltransferase
VYAEDEARLLIESSASEDELERAVARREAGEPLEVIVGWAEFCGLRVSIEPGVFVPRQRSALLVDLALEDLPADRLPLVLDLCCGSGALGLALAARIECELVATELDPAAVSCAGRNLAGRGRVYAGDLFDAVPTGLRGRFAVILANAPYVPSGEIALMPPEARDHEPLVALDGGADGLAVHRRIAAAAPDWLAPGGRLLIEVAEPQVDGALAMMSAAGLAAEVRHDDDRESIAVVGTRR